MGNTEHLTIYLFLEIWLVLTLADLLFLLGHFLKLNDQSESVFHLCLFLLAEGDEKRSRCVRNRASDAPSAFFRLQEKSSKVGMTK